jgi:hypothetical protein
VPTTKGGTFGGGARCFFPTLQKLPFTKLKLPAG